jgi:hypothetical protein
MRAAQHIKTVVLIALAFSFAQADGQTYYYFQDSPSTDFYDFSWMELTAPSELERKNSDLRKFPVEASIPAQQGLNSLRLKWKSMTGGDWWAIAAASGWANYDISAADTLQFYLRSESGISAIDLPMVFVEDVTNKKSDYHLISEWTDDIPAGVWTKVKISMDQFLDANDGTDFTQIKTIGFKQNVDDGLEHTLYIDDMRVYKGDGTAPPASQPTGVSAKGYEKHIEVKWDYNSESDLQGYRVERSLDGGETFTIIGIADADKNYYIDWVADLGDNVSASYQVRAINFNNEPSDPSLTADAGTKPFSDDELLDMVQEYTFRYFWDFGHEFSGLSRERNTSGNTVTSGGTGFGLMSIPVGIERGFITREEGAERILTMLTFLENADRFHGAWSHWLDGNTGNVRPFSPKDNGGDIVETSFVAQGLLTIRQYFTETNTTEQSIVEKATLLWEEIEWDWYRQNDSPAIYWHWSPDNNFDMNMQVRGWNEAAIVYLLAIASPTHGVPASLWETGWTANNYATPRTIFDQKLYVGSGFGGPLFFAHYSFLGFDPRDKKDDFANYFDQNKGHSLLQQEYCNRNTYGHTGYSSECWGLTASDDPDGYLAHEPGSNRDNGTISPTAALSSMPYTPEASMLALKHFYRNKGDKIWDWMGFKDAFNEDRNWYADSYLAIDQGPIILMIENYRTQLLWDLFMENPEIQPMLDAIGFTYSPNSSEEITIDEETFSVYPNPATENSRISFKLNVDSEISLEMYDVTGKLIQQIVSDKMYAAGRNEIELATSHINQGLYFLKLVINDSNTKTMKLLIQ